MTTAASLQSFRCGRMQTATLTVPRMAKQTGALILLIGIACIPGYGQTIALCILIVMACSNPAIALGSLATGTMVTCIGSPIASSPGTANLVMSVLKWVLLLVACGRCMLARVEPIRSNTRLLIYWAVVTAVLLMNAFFVSFVPFISALKAVAFSLGLLCILRLTMLTRQRNDEMLLFFAELGVAVFVVSVPLLLFHAGYSVNGQSFNGILNQPQALGIFLVMTGASAFAVALQTPQMSRVLILFGLGEWLMIFFTGSRTAFIALALGGLVYLSETVVRGGRGIRTSGLSTPMVAIGISGVLLAAMISPGIRDSFAGFLQKGGASPISVENPELAVSESSRGAQIFDALDLAEDHPFFGYGFGVDPESESNMDGNGAQFMGIPLSAPVEQGFLPLATIAQIGLIGSLFVFGFLLSIYRLARVDSAQTSALFAAVLGVNMGEMIFYSVGGLGILMWVMLCLLAAGGKFPQQPMKVAAR